MTFPLPHGGGRPYGFSSFMLRPHIQSFMCVVSCLFDAGIRSDRYIRADGRRLKLQLTRNFRLRLCLSWDLTQSRSDSFSSFMIPVETSTTPFRRELFTNLKILSIFSYQRPCYSIYRLHDKINKPQVENLILSETLDPVDQRIMINIICDIPPHLIRNRAVLLHQGNDRLLQPLNDPFLIGPGRSFCRCRDLCRLS